MTDKKRKTSTWEQRAERAQAKADEYKEKIRNREVRKFWSGEIRNIKGELNKDSTKNNIEKIQALVNYIYEQTEIYAELPEETEEEE